MHFWTHEIDSGACYLYSIFSYRSTRNKQKQKQFNFRCLCEKHFNLIIYIRSSVHSVSFGGRNIKRFNFIYFSGFGFLFSEKITRLLQVVDIFSNKLHRAQTLFQSHLISFYSHQIAKDQSATVRYEKYFTKIALSGPPGYCTRFFVHL